MAIIPSGTIRSVQYGSIGMAAGVGSATISSVNTAKAVLANLGVSGDSATDPSRSAVALTLTNSTTVSGINSTGAPTVRFVVVEYY